MYGAEPRDEGHDQDRRRGRQCGTDWQSVLHSTGAMQTTVGRIANPSYKRSASAGRPHCGSLTLPVREELVDGRSQKLEIAVPVSMKRPKPALRLAVAEHDVVDARLPDLQKLCLVVFLQRARRARSAKARRARPKNPHRQAARRNSPGRDSLAIARELSSATLLSSESSFTNSVLENQIQYPTRSVLTPTRSVSEGHDLFPRLRFGLVSLHAATSQSGLAG